MVDFIGIGAQKAGTSWVYACLFEHPEICAPVKEIHFFSRDRFEKGCEWYEAHWQSCAAGQKRGEFSTTYLYSDVAAARIAERYPDARLIMILREPAARAYSQYRNAIKAGEIKATVTFDEYKASEPSCLAQGLYTEQLERYYQQFPREQVGVFVYEHIERDPLAFIQSIYRHIGVDDTFVPPSLSARINVARTPKHVGVDSTMHRTAEWLRRRGLGGLVHRIKRSGVTDAIRAVNTSPSKVGPVDLTPVKQHFRAEVETLRTLVGEEVVSEWNYE